jgi:disulfide bond formation protein DsbB
MPRRASGAVFVLALATILAVLGVQFLGGYAPCHLCLYERWAYYAAVPVAAIAFAMTRDLSGWARVLLLLIALAFVANTALGLYHFGVEEKWWAGPSACTGGGSATDWRELAEQLKNTAVVRCDQPALKLLGLSLAFWNAAVSALLALIALRGAWAGGLRG